MSFIYNKRLRGWRFVLFNLCLGLGHAVVLFNAGAYIAMLPRVAGGLSIPASFATWTQTDYMISLALGFPTGAWLARQQGEYRPFVWAFTVFALASAACAYCTSLYGFLAARIVLGFAGGVTLPLGQTMILKEYPDRRKSIGIGVWSLFTLTPFTFGPPIGGWIADNLGWRWLFLFNIPVALAIGGIVGALLSRRGAKTVFSHFDWIGFSLLTLALGSFQTLLNQGNDWDWTNSGYLQGVAFTCLAAFLYWTVWELGIRRPFLDIGLFAHRNFTIGVLMLSIGFLFFQGLLSLLIIQLQLAMGYSSFLAGLVFLPMAIFAKPVASIFHEIVKRCDARPLASFNLLGFAGVYFWLSRFDDPSSFAELFWPKLIEGICLGSFFAPLTVLMLHGLPPARQARAVEIAGLMRIAAGAVGISLQATVLYRRAPFHMTRLAETVTPFDPGFDQATATLTGAGVPETAAIVPFAKIAKQQAAIHGVNDAFWIAGCVFTAMALLVWFAKPTREPQRFSWRRRALELLAREV
ncbi:DHA2 family efflux MFS transporter permease subunit [Methylomicrobium sp. Wu6]|uniref:DHA2 family efflux MFS transporter permease subunit n=1 Tax=Methylomicrobium sp. Wu6 TaxID=3107928 RepID=UPI002DD69A33|nr:DHA2 family efflux MFS transporter permease subunit [Methylomicrobium sp. Wu6]MEC4748378.1 DHA2 family efflux MFS transporter permease subunit [Methylomicrobium sp. Wu6]